jgi:ABC-type transporter lipoprotein component MlaA
MVDTTNAITMIPERGDVIEKNYKPLSDFGTARAYYFVGDELYVYPPTLGSVTYRLYYTRVPQRATTTSDTFLIPARHHSIIVYGALVKAFLVNDDPQAAVFQNMFEQRYQQMRADVWMNQYDRTERIHVLTDSYDWNY